MTDGEAVFSPDLKPVMDKIRAENLRVERSGESFVSIAYLVAVPAVADDTSVVLRHELQGAHLEQLQANRTEGAQPLIRLLVASTGDGGGQWRPVTRRLAELADSPGEQLLAVTGLGRSYEATQRAIQALAAAEIPMVASRLTADDLNGEKVPGIGVEGLVRVASTNTDEVKAMVAYLKPDIRRALLIRDTNPDDLYAQTLAEAFADGFPDDQQHERLSPDERYNGARKGVANRFEEMMDDICDQRPDVVYFAGRGEDLTAFVQALPQRLCLDLAVNVVSANSAVHSVNALAREDGDASARVLREALKANATLRYTTLAHPGAWAASLEVFSPAAISPFRDGCAGCFKSLFPGESLDDGGAIMGYDAVLTAVTAIRNVAAQRDLAADPIGRDEVIQEWYSLHGDDAVGGASGRIALDGDGNPVDKVIPILQLCPDGAVAFAALGSPQGTVSGPPASVDACGASPAAR